MKVNSIINRYIFMEMIPTFVINLVLFTFVFLMGNILRVTKLIVNYNVKVSDVLSMIAYLIPFFLEYVIPISAMITVLLTFLRMTSDSEIIAIEASGMNVLHLLPPVLVFCGMGFIFAMIVSIYGVPWGKSSMERLTYQIATQNIDIGLKERTFIDNFKGVTLYVTEIDPKNDTMQDVFIEDRRSKNFVSIIVAPKGIFFSNPEEFSSHLRLFNGTINQVNFKARSANSINFSTYDVHLNLRAMIPPQQKETKHKLEMTLADFREYFSTHSPKDAEYLSMISEYHQKFSIPFASIALGLLAVPLGIMSGSIRKAFGLGMGMFFFLLYYIMLFTAKVFGEEGLYSPVVGVWLPNAVMMSLGFYFLFRTVTNRQLSFAFLNRMVPKNWRSAPQSD